MCQADKTLARGALRGTYGTDVSVQLLRRLVAFTATLRPGDSWRQRPELHLAAVKACAVPSRTLKRKKKKKKQNKMKGGSNVLVAPALDVANSRAARFSLALSLVASCHPYCVSSSSERPLE